METAHTGPLRDDQSAGLGVSGRQGGTPSILAVLQYRCRSPSDDFAWLTCDIVCPDESDLWLSMLEQDE